MLDTSFRLETPEGAEVEIRPAGPLVRALAYSIDEIIRWIVVIGGNTILGSAGAFGFGVFAILLFTTYWLYGVLFEVLNQGMTPGKQMLSLQVIHDDGTPVRLPASMMRNLLLTVDFLPLFYGAAVITMMLNDRFRRIGDLAAATLVVYRSEKVPEHLGRVEGHRASPVPLTLQEQQALVAFAERSESFSDARNRELAGVLAPLLECSAQDAVVEVQKVANGIAGNA
ncbi:MAG: RDD family protein [Pseudomonadales bacterium]